ncbi:hypothetical protein C8Q79DRAFT_1106027 [Trametes meyenii]|nr:hypothetical protein C8Q79DRAFT_1106027 [Trametes meyenii]
MYQDRVVGPNLGDCQSDNAFTGDPFNEGSSNLVFDDRDGSAAFALDPVAYWGAPLSSSHQHAGWSAAFPSLAPQFTSATMHRSTHSAFNSTPAVMFPHITPFVDAPSGLPSSNGIPALGQPRQQHLLGAVDASALWFTMNTPSDMSSLTHQAIDHLPGNSRGKRKASAEHSNVEKPYKRQKQPAAEKIYSCPWPNCDRMWAHKYSLNRHYKAVHQGIRAHACSSPGCNRAFNRKDGLQRHIRSMHTDKGLPRREVPKA